jgi:hypothetical protein
VLPLALLVGFVPLLLAGGVCEQDVCTRLRRKAQRSNIDVIIARGNESCGKREREREQEGGIFNESSHAFLLVQY